MKSLRAVLDRLERKLRPAPRPDWTVLRWDIINAVIERLEARRYLEVGVSVGQTFGRVRGPVEKVGVDIANPRGLAGVIAISNDDFFARARPPFDVVFVDGLHS